MPVNLSTNARLTRRQKALRFPSAGGEWTVRPPVREFRSRCTTALIPTAEIVASYGAGQRDREQRQRAKVTGYCPVLITPKRPCASSRIPAVK